MKPFDAALKKMRAICLALPDTKETPTWGQPHFRVGEKIFAGLGEEKGVLTVGFKLEMDHADAMVRRPGLLPGALRRPQGLGVDRRRDREGLGRGRGARPRELPAHRAEEDRGDGIKNFGTTIWSTSKSLGSNAWNTAKSLGSRAWSVVKGLGSSAWNWAKGMGSKAWSGAKSLGSKAWSWAKSMGSKAWSGAKNLGSRLWSTAKSWGSRAWAAVKGGVSNVWGKIKALGSKVWERSGARRIKHGREPNTGEERLGTSPRRLLASYH